MGATIGNNPTVPFAPEFGAKCPAYRYPSLIIIYLLAQCVI